MDIITTSKGKHKVCLDGFMYTKQITSRNQIRWQCVKRHNQCKGIISTSLDLSQVLNSKPHNHDANLMEVEVADRFTHLVGYQHPSVWTMIDTLKKEDAVSCTHIVKDLNGQPPKKRIRREYKEMQTRLHKLCEDRAAGRKSIPELLSGVGHNIRWKPVNRENDD